MVNFLIIFTFILVVHSLIIVFANIIWFINGVWNLFVLKENCIVKIINCTIYGTCIHLFIIISTMFWDENCCIYFLYIILSHKYNYSPCKLYYMNLSFSLQSGFAVNTSTDTFSALAFDQWSLDSAHSNKYILYKLKLIHFHALSPTANSLPVLKLSELWSRRKVIMFQMCICILNLMKGNK